MLAHIRRVNKVKRTRYGEEERGVRKNDAEKEKEKKKMKKEKEKKNKRRKKKQKRKG